MIPVPLRAGALGRARHGFFTREGGVSTGPYASLNGSTRGGDDAHAVAENRARVASCLGAGADRMLGLNQVHGVAVATVTDPPWRPGEGPDADAMVTATAGLVLAVITADCAPVLFHDPVAGIVGAAHAGWRGAAAGVLEATVAAMAALGARPDRVAAAVGPCIGPASYEVGEDMRAALDAADPSAGAFFTPGARAGHFLFDLPRYCLARLRRAGIEAPASLDRDTLADADRFFSHRRRTLAGGGPIGHQISAIAL